MKKRLLLSVVLKSCAVFGYSALIFEWLVVAAPYTISLSKTNVYRAVVPEQITAYAPVHVSAPHFVPNWLTIAIVGIIAVGIIAVTIISLYRMPKTIGKAGQTITRASAEKIIPIVTHHKTIPARTRMIITLRIVFYIKLAFLIVPLLIVLLVPVPHSGVASQRELLMVVTGLLAGWALLLFSAQLVIARIFHAPLKALW